MVCAGVGRGRHHGARQAAHDRHHSYTRDEGGHTTPPYRAFHHTV